jgi:PDZ domain-containing secreted protein
MKKGRKVMLAIKAVVIAITVILIGVPLYAVPATFTLPGGPRPGVKELTIQKAAAQLRSSGKTGWELVEAARALVAERMQYSRRNSFDHSGRAFARGYGYCTQHSYALQQLMAELGFDAKVVQAFQNRFPNGEVTSHSWVSVTVNDETRHIDSLFYKEDTGELDFTPLSEVKEISPAFKLVAFWGGTAVNAHRYYLTGKDM